MAFKTYMLFKQPIVGGGSTVADDRRFDDRAPESTGITFKGRNEEEAMKKAMKFWRLGRFGTGFLSVKVVDPQP